MKRILSVLTAVFIMLSFVTTAGAAFDLTQANKATAPTTSKSCTGAMSVDRLTDSVMYSKKSTDRVPLSGGFVHLMTAYITETQRKQNSSALGELDEDRYELLLAGMLLDERESDMEQLVLSVCTSSDEFIELMNETAKDLGMNDTSFVNYSGKSDARAYTTLNDLLLLTDAAYEYTNIKSMLKSSTYTTSDKEMSFSRKTIYSAIDQNSKQYNKFIGFFVASELNDNGFVCIFTISSLTGREIYGAVYESGYDTAEYLSNYVSDITAIQKNAYSDYYQADLASVAKSLVNDLSYTLKDGSTVYVSLQIPSNAKSTKLFPSKYGVLAGDRHEDCYIEVNEELLPETAELGQILIDGKLKCKNDELMDVMLRTYKIKTIGGSIKTVDYVLFDLDEGERQAEEQYKKNDWIIAVGTVCLCAVGAVLVAEFVKRKMI